MRLSTPKRWLPAAALVIALLTLLPMHQAGAQSGYWWTYGDWQAWTTFSLDETEMLWEAHALAIVRCEEAIDVLLANRSKITQNAYLPYKVWFGDFDAAAYQQVLYTLKYAKFALEAGFTWDIDYPADIPDGWLTPEWITYSDTFVYFDGRLEEPDTSVGAWVLFWYSSINGEYCRERNQVYIGWGFWLYSEGDDPYWTKEGVIIHECTHMFTTLDIIYGETGCRRLASGQLGAYASSQAAYNADSYRYFVEGLY